MTREKIENLEVEVEVAEALYHTERNVWYKAHQGETATTEQVEAAWKRVKEAEAKLEDAQSEVALAVAEAEPEEE